MAFAVAQLEKNPRLAFGELKAAADKKGLSVLPIIYGRAKKALGLQRRAPVKPGRRVAGRSPAPVVPGAPPPLDKPRRGRPPKVAPTALDGSISQLMEAVQQAEVHRKALEQIQAILDQALNPRRGPGRPRKL
ncbi:MAG: hypothetical protein SF187_14975 [Deltaproteobacteria bacterium]|nr:hypothetical protein [Deltaproteobacteria bacterium]